MRYLLLPSFIIVISAKAQTNYLPYYQMINTAKSLTFDQKYVEAKNLYKKSLNNYIGFDWDYVLAIHSCLITNDQRLAYKLLKEKTIKTGDFSDDQLTDSLIKPFLNSKWGKRYVLEKPSWIEKNKQNIDNRVNYFWAQIDATDQFIRNGSLAVMRPIIQNDSLFTLARRAVFNKVDEQNFTQFKSRVKQYGFPGRFKLGGKEGYYSAFIIHHYKYEVNDSSYSEAERSKFVFMDSLMKAELINGQIQPWLVAYCYDYSISKDSVSYYAIPRYYQDDKGSRYINYPVIEPELLNQRRAAIGLGTVEEQCRILRLPLPPNYRITQLY